MDVKDAKQKLHIWLEEDYWKEGEVQYRFIQKRIIAEEYLGAGTDLKTYKFYCYNGISKVLYISMEEDRYIDYYDMEFRKLPYSLSGHEHYPGEIPKPSTLGHMIEIARKLSASFPFVRVDLYDSFGKIYISELTFIPTRGYMKIEPRNVLQEWGEWLELPRKKHGCL